MAHNSLQAMLAAWPPQGPQGTNHSYTGLTQPPQLICPMTSRCIMFSRITVHVLTAGGGRGGRRGCITRLFTMYAQRTIRGRWQNARKYVLFRTIYLLRHVLSVSSRYRNLLSLLNLVCPKNALRFKSVGPRNRRIKMSVLPDYRFRRAVRIFLAILKLVSSGSCSKNPLWL
jgi:hypothetical protein